MAGNGRAAGALMAVALRRIDRAMHRIIIGCGGECLPGGVGDHGYNRGMHIGATLRPDSERNRRVLSQKTEQQRQQQYGKCRPLAEHRGGTSETADNNEKV